MFACWCIQVDFVAPTGSASGKLVAGQYLLSLNGISLVGKTGSHVHAEVQRTPIGGHLNFVVSNDNPDISDEYDSSEKEAVSSDVYDATEGQNEYDGEQNEFGEYDDDFEPVSEADDDNTEPISMDSLEQSSDRYKIGAKQPLNQPSSLAQMFERDAILEEHDVDETDVSSVQATPPAIAKGRASALPAQPAVTVPAQAGQPLAAQIAARTDLDHTLSKKDSQSVHTTRYSRSRSTHEYARDVLPTSSLPPPKSSVEVHSESRVVPTGRNASTGFQQEHIAPEGAHFSRTPLSQRQEIDAAMASADRRRAGTGNALAALQEHGVEAILRQVVRDAIASSDVQSKIRECTVRVINAGRSAGVRREDQLAHTLLHEGLVDLVKSHCSLGMAKIDARGSAGVVDDVHAPAASGTSEDPEPGDACLIVTVVQGVSMYARLCDLR